jgi:hypothetical protein
MQPDQPHHRRQQYHRNARDRHFGTLLFPATCLLAFWTLDQTCLGKMRRFNGLSHALLNEPVWRYRIALFATLLFVLPPWSIISCVVTLIRLSHSECTVFSGDRHQVLVPLGRPDGGPRHQRRQKGTPHAAAVVMFAIALFCSLLWWLCIGVTRCRRLRSFCAGGMRRGETVGF